MPKWLIIIFIILICLIIFFFWLKNINLVFRHPSEADPLEQIWQNSRKDIGRLIQDFRVKSSALRQFIQNNKESLPTNNNLTN